MKTNIISGILFGIYFEHDDESVLDKGKPLYCIVIADNLEEAIAKVKSVWPGEVVNSAMTERNYGFGDQRVKKQKILY